MEGRISVKRLIPQNQKSENLRTSAASFTFFTTVEFCLLLLQPLAIPYLVYSKKNGYVIAQFRGNTEVCDTIAFSCWNFSCMEIWKGQLTFELKGNILKCLIWVYKIILYDQRWLNYIIVTAILSLYSQLKPRKW